MSVGASIDKNPGWTCPKCDRVYSPRTSECSQCNNKRIGIGPIATSGLAQHVPPYDAVSQCLQAKAGIDAPLTYADMQQWLQPFEQAVQEKKP